MLKKFGLIFVIVIFSFSLVWGQIISQYIDTNTGSHPKGIEIWNNTDQSINFSNKNLEVKKNSNDNSTWTSEATISSGSLASGEVLVIGGYDVAEPNLKDYMSANYPDVLFIDDSFTFNGNDALKILLDGTVTDFFGKFEDATYWSGNGVSTEDQNISLKSGINTGDTDGWTDPSLRFETTSTDNSMTGFGVCNNQTLPVTLSTFTAQYLNNTPTLNWTTQSESDNIGFYVYRNDENDYANASSVSGLIEGNGTTTEPHDYIFEDNIPNSVPGDTYYYWLESIDLGGEITHYNVTAILIIPEISDPGNNHSQAPELNGIAQNTPNPFNMLSTEKTNIQFALPTEAKIEISVFNIKGEFIQNIYNEWAESGTATWNGKDEKGTIQSSGIYLYRLLVNDKEHSYKKMIFMR